MRHPQTKALFRQWRDLCRNGVPPDRNELDPAAIASALRDIFILGRDPSGVWRYRVAGTRLLSYADRDLRNEPFTQWWRPDDRKDVARLLASTAEDRVPVVGGVSGLDVRNTQHEIEFTLLPLRHGGLEGQRLIGGFFPSPEVSALFDVRLTALSIKSLRNLPEHETRSDSFGRPRSDIERLVERRYGFRVIEGGKNNSSLGF